MSTKRQRRKVRQRARLLEEGAAPAKGRQRRAITVIEAGWGSSGYYSRDVLERDGAKAWPVGTHMYLNHPGAAEEKDRPERDVRDLVGVVASAPRMEGNALVAEADVFEHWAPVIDQLAPHIGVSIRAMGAMEQGEAEGRTGPVIQSLDEGISIDYVTKAGAGGKVGALIESAREQSVDARGFPLSEVTYSGKDEPGGSTQQESAGEETGGASRETQQQGGQQMSDAEKALREELEELKGRVAAVEAERDEANRDRDRAQDALERAKAERVVADATVEEAGKQVSVYSGLPERAIERIKEDALRGELPKTEDGKLHEGHLVERAARAAEAERTYLREAGVTSGKVTGMGESAPIGGGDSDGQVAEELEESFRALGLSESAAKVAAEGR